jgi:hypothetical protein
MKGLERGLFYVSRNLLKTFGSERLDVD